jgi:hypothetical protein
LLCKVLAWETSSATHMEFPRYQPVVRQEMDGMNDGLSIATYIWRLWMICIISTERIAFWAEVEGTQEEIFAMTHIELQPRFRRACIVSIPTHLPQLTTTPEYSFNLGDSLSEEMQWNSNRRAICNAKSYFEARHGIISHWSFSDGLDGACPLCRSHSTWTLLGSQCSHIVCVPARSVYPYTSFPCAELFTLDSYAQHS